MQKAGKEVMIGEGSAAAFSFNAINNVICRTRKREILDKMQQHVFDTLGYSEMAKSLKIPLINLHSGEIVEVPLKNGFVVKSVKIHKSLTEIEMRGLRIDQCKRRFVKPEIMKWTAINKIWGVEEL